MINETMRPFEGQPPTPSPDFQPIPPIKKKTGIIIKIIGGVIILGVIGVGAVLYTQAWDPLWNPFRPSPEKVIERMRTNMGEVKTLHTEGRIDLEAKADTTTFKMSLGSSGDSDTTDSQNPKSAQNFDFAVASDGTRFSLAGETKQIGETYYLKLTTFPSPPNLLTPEIPGIDPWQLKDRWIKFDREALENYGFYFPIVEETKMMKKIKELLKGRKLYYLKEEFPDEKIEGKKVYHYQVALDKEEVKKLIPDLLRIINESIPGMVPISEEELPEEAIEEISKRVDEFFEKVGEITAEVWIGKKDNFLYKVKGEKELDLSKLAEEILIDIIIIKVDLDFSNFNQPVKIEAPEEYKTIEEIFLILTEYPLLPGYLPQ